MGQDRPRLTIVSDADALANAAAEHVLARLDRTADPLAVCMSGGSTPERLYRLLATEPYRSALPWNRVHWFWGDDRLVPQDDPRSNAGMAHRCLLDRIPVPPGNVHAMPTGARSTQEAARLYEAQLRRYYAAETLDPRRPLFALVLMGLGEDGHTASLFPGHAEVDETRRWVVGVEQPGLAPFVPRVTLTLPVLASTREMLFLVSGRAKREVLARVLSGKDLPARRAYADGNLVWLVDHDAAPEDEDGA